jgi:hypothetical protein
MPGMSLYSGSGNSSNSRFAEFSETTVQQIHDEVKNTAYHLAAMEDDDALEAACHSKGYRNRIAGVWAYGLKYGNKTGKFKFEPVLELLSDEHELVTYAAKMSCIHMYLARYNERVDFGPTFQASPEEKNDAREMWELMFRKKEKAYVGAEKSPAKVNKEVEKEKRDEEENPFKRISKPGSKSVQDILEFKKLGLEEN